MGGNVTGAEEIVGRLAKLGKKLATKAMKAAVSQGTRVVMWEMKSRVRVVSGQLRKSLGRKTKSYRGGLKTVGIVGPRVGFSVPLRVAVRGKGAGKVVVADPVHYSHLVDRGTKRSRAFPFRKPTEDATARQVVDVMTNVISNAIEDAGG